LEGIPSQGVAAKHLIAMRLSTEALVAAAVTIVFVLLTFGAIAREQGQRSLRDERNGDIAASNIKISQAATNDTNALGFY
jgi:hypothetical protein